MKRQDGNNRSKFSNKEFSLWFPFVMTVQFLRDLSNILLHSHPYAPFPHVPFARVYRFSCTLLLFANSLHDWMKCKNGWTRQQQDVTMQPNLNDQSRGSSCFSFLDSVDYFVDRRRGKRWTIEHEHEGRKEECMERTTQWTNDAVNERTNDENIKGTQESWQASYLFHPPLMTQK